MKVGYGAWPIGLIQEGSLPVGAVTAFAGPLGSPVPATAIPADLAVPGDQPPIEAWGWMLCDGRALDVSGYPELFSVLGYLYSGSGDTFHIPDYRGTFLRGNDCGAGKDPDVALRTSPAGGDQIDKGIGSRQAAAMLFHEHTYQAVPLAVTLADVGETASSAPGQAMTSAPTDANGKLLTADISQFETRPCNTSVNYLIKFTCGVGPVWAQMWL